MKTLGYLLFFALICANTCCAADADSTDASEISALIKRLYSTPINDVEGKQQFGGKYDPNRGCEILKSFFVDRLIVRERPTSNCDTTGNYAGPFRFPSLDGENMSDLEEDHRLPRYKLISVSAKDDHAVAKIIIPEGPGEFDNWRVGRVIYFLVRTPQGWRITNMLTYNEWPLNLKGEYSDCREPSIHYSFALPPKSPDDFEDLPPACREMELDDRRRNGWGR